MSAKPSAVGPSEFRHVTTVTTRFSDQDSVGHINNVAYAAYFESGRIDYLNALFARVDADAVNWVVIASLKIDYRVEMFYPGTIEVASRIGRIGRSSFIVESALFKDGTMHASAEAVMVHIDPQRGSSVALSGAILAELQAG